jgi:hypothetical protein
VTGSNPSPALLNAPLLPAQIRTIRKKMVEIMTREATSCDLKELVGKFIPEAIGKEIEKACQGVYPLQVRAQGQLGARGGVWGFAFVAGQGQSNGSGGLADGELVWAEASLDGEY